MPSSRQAILAGSSKASDWRSERLVMMKRSPSGQLIQQVEDLIEAGSVQRPHLLEAISLVQSAHLKHKCDGGRSQAVLLVGLYDQRAVEPRCRELAGQRHD